MTNEDLDEVVRYYIDMLQTVNGESALHSLMELHFDCTECLKKAYFRESNPDIKQLIVHAIWQYRDRRLLNFLLDVLEHEDTESVWQEALDGIITLRETGLLESLKDVSQKKQNCISEAITLINRSYT